MVIQNIPKILKGLNSNTFNYLEAHSEALRLTKLLNNYQTQITSNQFIDDCVRINKPCKFEGLAKTWPAYEKWKFGQSGYSYLQSKLGDKQVEVYVDLDPSLNIGTVPGNSFKPSTLTKMKYNDFLKRMSETSVGVTLKDDDDDELLFTDLLPDIIVPQFQSEINDIAAITMIQGQTFSNPPRYEKFEQFLCSIDGYVQVKLIPHLYRQEVYAGKDRIITDSDVPKEEATIEIEKIPKEESPVNFFDPDYDNYPNFKDIERRYTVLLHEGDCVYIPAYYFHQYVAKPQNAPEKNGMKPSALSVILKYKNNSAFLFAFYEAIENNILT